MKKTLMLVIALFCLNWSQAQSWTADNGNGTYTNPILNEDFSDPDIIRVGNDFYMVGSTMHMMPGLPVLHSKDLVNWEFLTYVFNKLDLGPEFHLEGDKGAYGNGIWAPAIRYHKGTYYIFVNVNNYGLQVFTAQQPGGPWKHRNLGGKIYDLGILFDDDDKIYAVHGYDEVHLIQIKSDLTGYVDGSDRVIIPKGNAMGEGHHFYKVNGKYYIISANYAPVGRMQCARADRLEGPYETTVISSRETMGTQQGWTTTNYGYWSKTPNPGDTVIMQKPGENSFSAVPLHQGGIVDSPDGQWWGFSMMDARAAARMTYLSPVTWKNGWPYFGLEGNLGRSPRTWLKPVNNHDQPHAPFKRSDDFAGTALNPVWEWNHLPVDNAWSLTEKKGKLRLHTLPATDFLKAKNTLAQHVMGPESAASVLLDGSAMKNGDIAGLALLGIPYYWVGLKRATDGLTVCFYNELTKETKQEHLSGSRIYLKVQGNYEADLSQLSFSLDGSNYKPLGQDLRLGYQMKTFQGVKYALFAYNANGEKGGYADFDDFILDEPFADRSKNLPLNKVITFRNLANGFPAVVHQLGMLHFGFPGSKAATSDAARFRVLDRGQGRIALQAFNGNGFLTVVGEGLSGDVRLMASESEGSLFQWQDLLRNQFMLLSLKTHRYVGLNPLTNEPYAADWPGTRPDRKDGTVLVWEASTK